MENLYGTMKTLEFFQHAFTDKVEACKGGVIISMRGYKRFEDFYLCIPASGIHFRNANNGRYGLFMLEVFMDGEFVGATRSSKKEHVTRLYNEGFKNEAEQYALGYMLWKETSLGGRRTNRRKEAARISHAMCCESGKRGHELRQEIRKHILRKV